MKTLVCGGPDWRMAALPERRFPAFPQAVFVTVLLATALSAAAHPISMMTGQAVVRTNEVAVILDVMVEDFMLFYGLVPDGQNHLTQKDIQASIARHGDALLKEVTVRNADGERLSGALGQSEAEDVPPEGYEVGSLMQRMVRYHLRYPLASPPALLTFQQTVGSRAAMAPGNLELEVRRDGVSVSDFASLSNQGNTETFEFNWDEPGDREGESLVAAWRRRQEERKQARMGITSYDAVYGFVYITDHEVRTEILIPLATLETWIRIPRRDPEFLEPDEQEAARTDLEAFFCGKNKVMIDGMEVKPTLQRLDFYGVSFADFASRPEAARVSVFTARAGAILSYSTKAPPAKVDMTWDYFNAASRAARTVVYAYDQTVQQAFTPQQPVFTWQSPDRRDLPRITELEAGPGGTEVTDEQARAVAGTLLRNIYRAFDYRRESDIYDALARSVQGDLLADLYLKIHGGLAMQEQGGAIAAVRDVQVTSAQNLSRGSAGGYSLRLTWTVEGTVEHWGHIHTRVNEYSADFTVQPLERAWKITRMGLADQKRLRYQVRLRSF